MKDTHVAETEAARAGGFPSLVETVTLRAATAGDAVMLGAIGAATFLESFTWLLPGADLLAFITQHHTAEAYARYLAKPDTRITLALTGPPQGFAGPPGAPVGYAMLAAPDLPTLATGPADIELKRIYVFSRFRRAPVLAGDGAVRDGVKPAQALLDAAIADAQGMGRTRMLLGTHATNVRAIAFYRRNGFVEAGRRTFQVGTQCCQDLIFAREL